MRILPAQYVKYAKVSLLSAAIGLGYPATGECKRPGLRVGSKYKTHESSIQVGLKYKPVNNGIKLGSKYKPVNRAMRGSYISPNAQTGINVNHSSGLTTRVIQRIGGQYD